ncbi:hypothetical protein [Bifidobacterium sp.]|uniref:hypothetical protein n=1 Tax=Bifidobacterium sp. TaxID=41200 RepID=UPI0039EC1A9E
MTGLDMGQTARALQSAPSAVTVLSTAIAMDGDRACTKAVADSDARVSSAVARRRLPRRLRSRLL